MSQREKMSQYGKGAAKNRLEICHRWTKCHRHVNPETGVDVKSWDVRMGVKCHEYKVSQWALCLGRNVQWTIRSN
jgi:hypothetical protein